MKQEIISYLHGHYDELFELNKYLYTNPEPSYKEFKSYDYITNFLKVGRHSRIAHSII